MLETSSIWRCVGPLVGFGLGFGEGVAFLVALGFGEGLVFLVGLGVGDTLTLNGTGVLSITLPSSS
jgi:hypothetical protein